MSRAPPCPCGPHTRCQKLCHILRRLRTHAAPEELLLRNRHPPAGGLAGPNWQVKHPVGTMGNFFHTWSRAAEQRAKSSSRAAQYGDISAIILGGILVVFLNF
ncbi:hypothetical protein B0I72DRAFT_172193 [Yarrowia lipolytica]|nr:hypothetical protein B0I72DRAFT_172193 [Yarrowia lipolytica]